MKKLLIDEAPGKEFIAHIKATGDPDALDRFIRLRLDWHGYPIIHDRFVTYSIFDDLEIDTLTEEVASRIFDYLLGTLSDTRSDVELSAWVFLLNLFRERRPFRSLADSTKILHSLMAHEKRIGDLKTKDGNLSFWLYQLRNFFSSRTSDTRHLRTTLAMMFILRTAKKSCSNHTRGRLGSRDA